MSQQFGWLKMEELKQIAAVERLKALEKSKIKTAESLGITRTTLDSLLAAFDKRSAEDQSRIAENNKKLQEIMNQDRSAFEYDTKTGHSSPKPPRPLPKIDLIMPLERGSDPLSTAANQINNEPRIQPAFKPVVQPSPRIPVPAPLADEAQREHERFAKLDKTLYSEKFPIGAREQAERAQNSKPKTSKPASKKTKAKAGK